MRRKFYHSRQYGRIANFAATVGFVVVLAAHVFAGSMTDYRERLESAKVEIDDLMMLIREGEIGYEPEIIDEIRSLIPVKEKIDGPGGGLETDNQWLRLKLGDFAAETDESKRLAILTAISERIVSIAASVRDLENAVEPGRSKDQDKQKLAEILRRAEYQKPAANEESLFQKWWRQFSEWISKWFPKPTLTPGDATGVGSLQYGLQIIIFALVIGLIAYLLYRFLPLFIRRFGRDIQKRKSDRVVLGEHIGADSSAAALFADAEELARAGDLRAAIRKGYIALLCELSDRKLVRLARHKTNRDYLCDVRQDAVLYRNMSGLTRDFETSWYGTREADEKDWQGFRNGYIDTIVKVNR